MRSSRLESAKFTSIIILQSSPSLAILVFSTFAPQSNTVFANDETNPGRSGPNAVMMAFSALANWESGVGWVENGRRVVGDFEPRKPTLESSRKEFPQPNSLHDTAHTPLVPEPWTTRELALRTAEEPARAAKRAKSCRKDMTGVRGTMGDFRD